MEWMGKMYSSADSIKELLDNLLDKLEAILVKRYESQIIDVFEEKIQCFKAPDGNYFYPGYMFGGTDNQFHCLVVEYAESIEEMQKYWEDEGNQFFPEDYDSEEELFGAILKEIDEAN